MRIVLDLQGAQSESRFRGIGRYTLGLAEAIARGAGQHEIWLALSSRFPDSIEPLRFRFADLIPTERICVFEVPGPVAELDPANTWRMQAAELLREKFLVDLRPDIVHVSTMLEGWGNEVVVSAGRFNPTLPTVATLYDLIPLLRSETYLSNAAAKRSYLRHAQSLTRANVLLAISESSRQEAIQALRISPERIVTIGAGIDQTFYTGHLSRDEKARLMTRYEIRRPFVLHTSAVEPRKNVEGLISAFALLPQGVRLAHQLVIVGRVWEDDRKRLDATAKRFGLNADEMLCLDHVPDEDLRLLYANCSVFVFPSFHEGLGLPLLEAMVAGAPVIGSNCTSIPEIINRKDALFDPEQPCDIAIRIAEVLTNAELQESLRKWGRERAKDFTWETCARRALEAFEGLHQKRKCGMATTAKVNPTHRPLLAFVSPLPPEKSAASDCSVRLLPNLARHYEIVCIVDQAEVTDPWINAEFPIRDVRWFEANAGGFERILYQIGNSPPHKHILALLERHPGIVVLHNFYLSSLLDWMAGSGYAPGSFIKALYDSHGFLAVKKYRAAGRESSIEAFPCSVAVFQDSYGVIVHSNEVRKLIQTWYGNTTSAVIRVLPSLPDRQQSGGLDQAHNAERIAALYRQTIEEIYVASSKSSEQRLVQAIVRLEASTRPSDLDLAKLAAAIVANRNRFRPDQILLDITDIARNDSCADIQRAARGLLMALLNDPARGYRLEPVRVVGNQYFYARRFACRCIGLAEDDMADDPVEVSSGDIFLGLEWGADFVPSMKPWFLSKRRRGMQTYFLVYDMLPVIKPEFFPPHISPMRLAWLKTVVEVANGVVCISRTAADELFYWLAQEQPDRLRPLSLGFFRLGADIRANLSTRGPSRDSLVILTKLHSRPSFLMVGTIEPRTGHRQALAAMEQLWANGLDANLVIIGQRGWMMEEFTQQIEHHPERDNRLFWLQGISDEMLEQIYRNSSALLVASVGEGFCLPLIEAAQYGLPIIGRDIPVFRELAGEHAYYFRGEGASELADALRAWLSLRDRVPTSAGMPCLTWEQSSRQLLDVVLGKRWYSSWPNAEKIRPAAPPP